MAHSPPLVARGPVAGAMSAANAGLAGGGNPGPDPTPDDLWLRLWETQRDEVSSRLSIEDEWRRGPAEPEPEPRAVAIPRAPPQSPGIRLGSPRHQPPPPSGARGPAPPPGGRPQVPLEQVQQLRELIATLSERQQVVLSEYVLARAPHAIVHLDGTGVASIDPFALDAAAFDAVMWHVELLAQDGDAAGPGRAGPPPAAAAPASPSAVPRLPSLVRPDALALTPDAARARKGLARRLQMLPEAAQKEVSREVQLVAPWAMFHPAPGLATINTLSLDPKAYARVEALLQGLEAAHHIPTPQERARARQEEQASFLTRERARERQRHLWMEREKQLRVQQVMEDLERDLACVRGEADQELKTRWHAEPAAPGEGDVAGAAPGEAEVPHDAPGDGGVARADTDSGPVPAEELRGLQLQLQATLTALTYAHLKQFADFARALQPGSVRDGTVGPSAFGPATIRPALERAEALRARQGPPADAGLAPREPAARAAGPGGAVKAAPPRAGAGGKGPATPHSRPQKVKASPRGPRTPTPPYFHPWHDSMVK